jgi:hypothetical protein
MGRPKRKTRKPSKFRDDGDAHSSDSGDDSSQDEQQQADQQQEGEGLIDVLANAAAALDLDSEELNGISDVSDAEGDQDSESEEYGSEEEEEEEEEQGTK